MSSTEQRIGLTAVALLLGLSACNRPEGAADGGGPSDAGDAGPLLTVPGAPAALTAIEGDAQVSLQWTSPMNTGGKPITGYRVSWSQGDLEVSAAETRAVISGLMNGTSYSFVVSATNEIGTGPASVASSPVVPGAVPLPPGLVTASAAFAGVTVDWTPSDGRGRTVTGYAITAYAGGASSGEVTVTTDGSQSTIVTGLTPGTSYAFRVKASNALGVSGDSPLSNTVTVPIPLPPGIPRAVTATSGATQALVKWAAPRNNGGAPITGYKIVSTPGNFVATTSGATQTQVTGLLPGINYTFKVTAVNAAGSGPTSTSSQAIMIAPGVTACLGKIVLGSVPDPVSSTQPRAVAVVHLDADPKLDLATIDVDGLRLQLGNGNGTFQSSVLYAAGVDPSALAVGDLNADGKADFVLSSASSGTVSVFLSNGLGAVNGAGTYMTGSGAKAVSLGDLNADGKVDLVVANESAASVSVLIGNGPGTFLNAVNYAVTFASAVGIGDFNRDGSPDLAVAGANGGDLNLLLGNGDGTFAVPQSIVASGGTSIAVADFNGDTDPDLVIGTSSFGSIVLLGNGDATFAPSRYAMGAGASPILASDLNGDGRVDLALVNNGVLIATGNGDGTFQTGAFYSTGNNPLFIASGDLTSDGLPDLVVANRGNPFSSIPSGSVSVLLASAGGAFVSPPVTALGQYYLPSIASADFNLDGKLDVAATQQVDPSSFEFRILLSNGNGTFQPPVTFQAPPGAPCVNTGDFNGDGFPDLVAGNGLPGGFWFYRGNGDGTFQAGISNPANGSSPRSIAVNDFNGDGKLDLVIATSAYFGIDMYLGKGDGSFQPPSRIIVGTTPVSLLSGDFNGDGDADVAVANEMGKSVSVLFGAGDGTLLNRQDYALGSSPASIATGDFNEDGAADLTVALPSSGTASILLNTGNGTFAPPVHYQSGSYPETVVVRDLNADGHADISLTRPGANRVGLLLGNGDGTLKPPVQYSSAGYPASLLAGQFDGDGRPDLVVLSGVGVALLLSQACLP